MPFTFSTLQPKRSEPARPTTTVQTSGVSSEYTSFNPFSTESTPRRSRWDTPDPSRTPRHAQTSSSAFSAQPIPIPRTRNTSFGGTRRLQPPDNSNRSYEWSDSELESGIGDSAYYDDDESPFPMENDSRPASRLSGQVKRSESRSGPAEGCALPPVTSPYGHFKPQSRAPQPNYHTQPQYARGRRDSFTSANPALGLSDLSSALPYQSTSQSATARQSPASNSQPFGFSKSSNRPRSSTAGSGLSSPPPVSAAGAERVVGFEVPQQKISSPETLFQPKNFAVQQQQSSMKHSPFGSKRKASFYIDDRPQSYDSSSSVGSMTPRSGSAYPF